MFLLWWLSIIVFSLLLVVCGGGGLLENDSGLFDGGDGGMIDILSYFVFVKGYIVGINEELSFVMVELLLIILVILIN